MVDITHKNNTLRIALAEATLNVSHLETMEAIKNKKVPKGDVFEMSRAAGFLGIKNTPLILPDCHPLPIESCKVFYAIDGLSVKIQMEVKTIYKTGVEVEAMHGVSVIALNMYDMLKPIDKGVSINNIRLLKKSGGKSNHKNNFSGNVKIIVCSDRAYDKKYEDLTGPALSDFFKQANLPCSTEVVPDNVEIITSKLKSESSIILFAGGTGYGERDYTFSALEPHLDYRILGAEEKIRQFGNDRTPYAMLSKSLVGVKGNQLIIAIPGSPKGALESVQAIFPGILHIFDIIDGKNHDNN